MPDRQGVEEGPSGPPADNAGGAGRPFNLIHGLKASANQAKALKHQSLPVFETRGEGRGPPPDPGDVKAPHPDDLGRGQDGGQFGGFEGLPGRLARYGKARSRALHILRYVESLAQAGSPKRFTRLGDEVDLRRIARVMGLCGRSLNFRHYYTVDQVRLTEAYFCKHHLLCPLCAIRRGSRMMETYVPKFEAVVASQPQLKPALLTLTVKNGSDLAERFDHLKVSARTLFQRRRQVRTGERGCTEMRKVAGAIGSFEVTQKGNGWHPHMHMVVLLEDWIDQPALSGEWHDITGDSFIVGINRLDPGKPPAKAFAEVCKYALKFSEMTDADTWHCFMMLRGARLAFSLGLFRGLTVPEDLRDEPLEGLPYFDFLYHYMTGKGYELDNSCIA